ncbi:hypothetical protein PENTCL1PPCAC_29654, partial [Pristionchus entomophagus]
GRNSWHAYSSRAPASSSGWRSSPWQPERQPPITACRTSCYGTLVGRTTPPSQCTFPSIHRTRSGTAPCQPPFLSVQSIDN